MTDKAETACSVCHSAPFKYRCPRCPTIRTCSLPCYKRHQQRATCTGQRNEATYRKKSELTNAAAIDHDYNFLSKIERGLRTTDDPTDDGSRPSKRRRLASNPLFDRYLRENEITVHTAPPGLHRAKTNQSRFLPKSKKVAWTVEWVGAEGEKHITEVMDDESMWSAYSAMASRFLGGHKRLRFHTPGLFVEADTTTHAGKERETIADGQELDGTLVVEVKDSAEQPGEGGAQETESHPAIHAVPLVAETAALDQEPTETMLVEVKGSSEQLSEGAAPQTESQSIVDTAALSAESGGNTSSGPASEDSQPAVDVVSLAAETDTLTLPAPSSEESSASSAKHNVHLYLLRPRCLSNRRVLHPLTYTSTLTEALRKHSLDEYPTIYHLPFSPSQLPEDQFWTSEQYTAHLKRDLQDLDNDEIVRQVQATLGAALGPDKKGDDDEKWDAKRVLEMLRRDVDGLAKTR